MHNCSKCNKTFKYDSELTRHKNRKVPCDAPKKEYKCEICNVNFICPAEQTRHEKTKKHINNYNTYNQSNVQNNIHGDNIQNIIQLTLNVHSFKETDMSFINRSFINDMGNYIKEDILENKKFDELKKLELIFDEIIILLEKLHFNIGIEENHNLKILLIFPGIKKAVYEYLILEINPETKNILWNSLQFEDLIKNILDNLLILNTRRGTNYVNYNEFINFVKDNLLNNNKNLKILKPIIDKKLSEMYVNFNKKQNKLDRTEHEDFDDKINEYRYYRKKECKLNNGFDPEIINSKIV